MTLETRELRPYSIARPAHTSALTELVDDLVNRSPSVLPQELFARDLVNGRVSLVTGQLAAGVCECGKDNAESSAVAHNRGCRAD